MILFRAMPELPTTFGKYYLTEKLATGGMAEIYLAKLIGPGGFEKFVVINSELRKKNNELIRSMAAKTAKSMRRG